MTEYPLVTNAIPLYKSKPFVDIMVANIDAIAYPNIEILISDRHQYDDAIDILADHYRDDTRVTILRAKDELTYSQHYNLLLFLGHGKYFRWMPHDDSYPRCCLREKVEILESRPEIVLVNGPWHKIDQAGDSGPTVHPRKSPLGRWSYESSVFIAFGDYEYHAFKGLFRRTVAITHQIWLFDTFRIIAPERCWEFAMSLMGEFYDYTGFTYYKRFYPGSTQHTWLQNKRPIDFFYSSYYKFKYQWALDRKPLRIIAFFVLLLPLTYRLVLLHESPSRWKPWIREFPGKRLKWIREFPGKRLKWIIKLLLSKL